MIYFTKKLLAITVALLLPVLLISGCSKAQPAAAHLKNNVSLQQKVYDNLRQPKLKVEPQWKPVEVKGIYLTGWSAGSRRFDYLLKKVMETEINAMVIDIKDATGKITYSSQVPLAKKMKATSNKIPNIKELLETLNKNGIYPIARLVVFKDPLMTQKKPEWAVRDKNGNIWKDNKGLAWLDPYNKQVWEYIVDLAVEAGKLGFREIQFDYVRFPTDGNLDNIVYPGKNDTSRSKVIKQFLRYAKSHLEPRGIYVSADVFGLVTSAKDDMKIGQILEDVAQEVDYICPMVYPSHYARGTYGIPDPNSSPYKTVYRSLSHAVNRLKQLENNKAILRPWLQDFSLGYPYGAKEVRDQIKATYDVGLTEWILWNPANIYTWSAIKPLDSPPPSVKNDDNAANENKVENNAVKDDAD